MRPRSDAWRAAVATLTIGLVVLLAPARAQQLDLPEPRIVAPGVLLYHLDRPALVNPEGPISIWALRLDPARVDLQAALANDEIMGTETVGGIAQRHPAGGGYQRGLLSAERRPGGRA